MGGVGGWGASQEAVHACRVRMAAGGSMAAPPPLPPAAPPAIRPCVHTAGYRGHAVQCSTRLTKVLVAVRLPLLLGHRGGGALPRGLALKHAGLALQVQGAGG